MKKRNKLLMAGLCIAMVFCMTACGGDGAQEESGEGVTSAGTISEDYFTWDENLITGLTEAGLEQEALTIPERCEGFKDDGIYPFHSSQVLKSIDFESEKDIEIGSIFSSCAYLENIALPDELTRIEAFAFSGNYALKEIYIPAGVVSIGSRAFADLESLTTVEFAEGVTDIGEEAFLRCISLTEISFSNSIEAIGEKAFYDCESLEKITLPASLKSIGAEAFWNCALTDVNVPREVELATFESGAFIQAGRGIAVHVVEGSWMDQHFEEVFTDADTKDYSL